MHIYDRKVYIFLEQLGYVLLCLCHAPAHLPMQKEWSRKKNIYTYFQACIIIDLLTMFEVSLLFLLQERQCLELWMVFHVLYGKILIFLSQFFCLILRIKRRLISLLFSAAAGPHWLLHCSCGCSTYIF